MHIMKPGGVSEWPMVTVLKTVVPQGTVGSNPTPSATLKLTPMANQIKKTYAAFQPELIAPCGMNCSICSGYLAYSRNIPKRRGKITHCTGCRPRNKQCAFLKGRCQKLSNNRITFCFECDDFPCYSLRHIDARYRKNYDMSMIDNLNEIKQSGIDTFLKNQRKKYKCPRCGGVICVHNRKCYDCETIENWKG